LNRIDRESKHELRRIEYLFGTRLKPEIVMRRHSLLLTILIAIVIAAGLTWWALRHHGFGTEDLVTESRPLAPFSRIEVAGAALVTLVQDTNGPLVVETPARGKARVVAAVVGDTLEITAADSRKWWDALLGSGPSGAPRITIHFRDLEAIKVAGGVRISAGEIRVPALRISGAGGTSVMIDDLHTASLRVTGEGALKAELAGQATDQSVAISGAGDYRADRLASSNTVVTVSGAGKVFVNASKTLKTNISGAGVVEYLGNPEVTEQISGVGRVKRRDSSETAGPHLARAQ
jgi:hypothetical protein